MGVKETLQNILDVIKFSLTEEQILGITEELNKLSDESYEEGKREAGYESFWGRGID